jgi:hypothetical protein
MALVMRAESCDEVRIKAESSEGGTKSALGDCPKAFMLALATLSIRKLSLERSFSCQGGANALAGNQFLFSAIITVIIISA